MLAWNYRPRETAYILIYFSSFNGTVFTRLAGRSFPRGRISNIAKFFEKHGRKVLSTVLKNVYTPTRLHYYSLSLSPSSCTFPEKQKRKQSIYLPLSRVVYIYRRGLFILTTRVIFFCAPWIMGERRIWNNEQQVRNVGDFDVRSTSSSSSMGTRIGDFQRANEISSVHARGSIWTKWGVRRAFTVYIAKDDHCITNNASVGR